MSRNPSFHAGRGVGIAAIRSVFRASAGYRATHGVLLGIAMGAPGAVSAADTDAGASASTLPAVTVTSTREATGTADEGYRDDRVSQVGPWQGRKLQDTPYSITVFSEDLMKNLQATSADQVLRINPTLQLTRTQSENNQPTMILRGFNFYSSYRDGVPDDQYGHATTIEDTERIEVFNGLSGFLYGAGNVGGLLNYVSKRSTDERLNELTAYSLGNKAWNLHGDFGGKFDAEGRFGYRLNLARQRGETPIKGQAIDRDLYSLILDAKPRNDLYLMVSAARLDYDVLGSQASWVATAATRPSANALRNDRSYGPGWTRRWYQTNRYMAKAEWDVNAALRLRAAYLKSDGTRNYAGSPATNTFTSRTTYNQVITNIYAPGVTDVLSYQHDESGAAYADFSFSTGRIGHKLTAGYQYSDSGQDRWSQGAERIDGGASSIDAPRYISRPDTVAPTLRGTRSEWFSTIKKSVVLGDDIVFNERWSLLAGLAYTTISTNHEERSALTPSVSLLFRPIPDLTNYLTYMESLESGGRATEQYQGADVVNSGQVFPPLLSRQLELGAKYSLGGVLLSGALFQINKGLQYYDVSNPAAPVYVQDGRQVHRGVEFTAIGQVTPNLSVLGGFTWLDPEIKKQAQDRRLEGKRPSLVADKMLKLRLEYAVSAVPGLSLSGGVIHTSASYADLLNTDRLPSYTVFDAGARYPVGPTSNPVILRLNVTNLTNRHYWSRNDALGEPRIVMLSASYKF